MIISLSCKEVQGNSGVYKVLGALLLFISFLAFNAAPVVSSDLALAGLAGANTTIAAAFSCFTVMAIKIVWLHYELHYMHSVDGILAGCVAITSGALPPCQRCTLAPLLFGVALLNSVLRIDHVQLQQ